jgi:hypothetical protein
MMDLIFNADAPYDAFPTERLRELLAKGTKPERARAMGALARRAGHDRAVWDECLAAIENPIHRGLRLMGSISIAHIGVACSWSVAPQELRERLRALIDRWPEPDRGDLLWFLRSQDLMLDSPGSSDRSTRVRMLYQTLCDDSQPEIRRAEAHVGLLAVAGVATTGVTSSGPLDKRVDWVQIDRIVRESGAATASEQSAEATDVSYGHGSDDDPINDGRIDVTARREGTFTVEHVHGVRRLLELARARR